MVEALYLWIGFLESAAGSLVIIADMSSSDILTQPFLPPPPGVVANPLYPQTRGSDLTVTCSVFLSIMIFFVSIRTYTKLWITRKVTWDDRTSPHPFILIQ